MFKPCWRSLVLAVAVLGSYQGASAQNGSLEGGRPISPTVVVTWASRGDQLALMVLWRGKPGWYWKDGANLSSSDGARDGRHLHQGWVAGGTAFGVDYDFDSGIATIGGTELPLRTVNVALVDQVDSSPRIVKTLHVTNVAPINSDVRAFPDGTRRVTGMFPERSVIPNNPELFQFLECDSKALPPLSPPAGTFKADLIKLECDQLRPPSSGKAK